MSQVEVSFSPLSDSSLNRLNKWINEKQGYGFTRTAGYWKENDKFAKEKSFFVVNLHDDPEFFDKMFSISEFLNQDSFRVQTERFR